MSGGTFARCEFCKRLLIYGQRCVCDEPPAMACDCTYRGNRQHIGPLCRQRISDVWGAVLNRRDILR